MSEIAGNVQRCHVPNNDFNRSKQGKNCTKDTVVTYLYIKNPQKLSTASTNLFNSLKAKCIYTYSTCTCSQNDNYLPHMQCYVIMCYIVLIKITLNMHASSILTCMYKCYMVPVCKHFVCPLQLAGLLLQQPTMQICKRGSE